MGCCVSSPHARRKYYDPADLDEEFVSAEDLPLRTFGVFRGNQAIVPDDIDGLPSTREYHGLASNPDILLYEAEIDNGRAWRCLRPCWAVFPLFPVSLPMLLLQALFVGRCSCDEICCWVRKEYATRNYYRVYPNRIEYNFSRVRIPWGFFGCGSWNADNVHAHPFDRGAFGFHRVQFGVCQLLCCYLPMYGDVVARQRCQCNGPVWQGGWWCDEWPCNMMCCTFRYPGLANGDEVAFASNLALQAYFEGRKITADDMENCLEYWRQNVSEYHDPIHRKRDVMCTPCSVPCFPTTLVYKLFCQPRRKIPFQDERATKALKDVYKNYETLRLQQIDRYAKFKHPVRQSTVCRAMGCRRVFGRKGLIFCTEGCNDNKAIGCCYKGLKRQPGDPFPPPPHPDIDDNFDAATVLQEVLGNPPKNVVYRKWEWDPSTQGYIVNEFGGKSSKQPEQEEPTIPSTDTTNHRPSERLSLASTYWIQNGRQPSEELTSASDRSAPPGVEVEIGSSQTQEASFVTAAELYKGSF